MATNLLNSLVHYCFRSPVLNLHKHPDLYRCSKGAAYEALIKSTSTHVQGHSDLPKRVSAIAPADLTGWTQPPDTIIPTVNCAACDDLATAMSKGATPCTASIGLEMATKAGIVDANGNVSCPICGGPTTFVPGEQVAEVHAKLCTDPYVHYPDMHKAAKLSDADFTAWKATLTRDELLGHYWRVPEHHIVANFTHEETGLIDTDRDAFNALVNTRIRERAEAALLHQIPYRHTTKKQTIQIT